MSEQLYFKLPFGSDLVQQIKDIHIDSGNTNFVMYVDLNGMNKAAFNKQVIKQEIADGAEQKYMIKDLKKFIQTLLKKFEEFNPKLVIFYDEGGSKQNKDIDPNYKAQRVSLIKQMIESGDITKEEGDFYNELKKQYQLIIEKNANVKGKFVSINLKNYESDGVADYCIRNNLIPNATNIILANDKDLLQSLDLPHTYQISFSFKPTKGGWYVKLWDDKNCIFKLYDKLEAKLKKMGYNNDNHPFNSKSIIYMLSIAGDTSDNIPQLWSRLGPATAIDIIDELELYNLRNYNNLKSVIIENSKMNDSFDRLKLNLQLVDFDLQFKRIPQEVLDYIHNKINFLMDA